MDIHFLTEPKGEPLNLIHFTFLSSDANRRKNIYPVDIYIPIAEVFMAFLNQLSQRNNILHEHISTPSSIQALHQKETLSEIPNH